MILTVCTQTVRSETPGGTTESAPTKSTQLRIIHEYQGEELGDARRPVISPDNRFLYVPLPNQGSIVWYEVAESGQLHLAGKFEDDALFNGISHMAPDPSGATLAVSVLQGHLRRSKFAIFDRDEASGDISLRSYLNHVGPGGSIRVRGPSGAAYAGPDAGWLVADPYFLDVGNTESGSVFRVDYKRDGTLDWKATAFCDRNRLQMVRSIAWLARRRVAISLGGLGHINVLQSSDRDLEIVHSLQLPVTDGRCIIASPDQRFLYCLFGGKVSHVLVLKFNEDDSLSKVQSLNSRHVQFRDFDNAVDMVVTDDSLFVASQNGIIVRCVRSAGTGEILPVKSVNYESKTEEFMQGLAYSTKSHYLFATLLGKQTLLTLDTR